MKVTKKTSVQGEWAKAKEDYNDGDLIKIMDSGEVVSGTYGDRSVFKVLTSGGEKNLSFNQTTMNYLIDAFGDDTEKWVDVKVKVWLLKSMIDGKMKTITYLTAPDWVEKDEKFCPPGKEDVETIEED